MPVAGHLAQFGVRTDTTAISSTDEVDGIGDVTFSPSVEMLEVTDFKDGGFKVKLPGLSDGSFSASGQLEWADAATQVLVTAWSAKTLVNATFIFNPSGSAGSRGFRVPCYVESWEAKGVVAGTVDASWTLAFSGAPVAV